MIEKAQEDCIEGGNDRNGSILNIIKAIESNGQLTADDILVTHDAVRPFVSYRIITDNIEAMNHYDVCDTVVMANDTIVESTNGKTITSIPDRSYMFQGQTPQTFRISAFRDLFDSLSDDMQKILTDACKVFVLNDRTVGLVNGEYSNIKITTVTDLKIAQAMLGEFDNDK